MFRSAVVSLGLYPCNMRGMLQNILHGGQHSLLLAEREGQKHSLPNNKSSIPFC